MQRGGSTGPGAKPAACTPVGAPGRTLRLRARGEAGSALGADDTVGKALRCPRRVVSTGCGGAGVTLTPSLGGDESVLSTGPASPPWPGRMIPAQDRLSPCPRANPLRIDLSRQAAAPLPARPGRSPPSPIVLARLLKAFGKTRQ